MLRNLMKDYKKNNLAAIVEHTDSMSGCISFLIFFMDLTSKYCADLTILKTMRGLVWGLYFFQSSFY